jgi:Spy/CpxP family protein refolding chaperone
MTLRGVFGGIAAALLLTLPAAAQGPPGPHMDPQAEELQSAPVDDLDEAQYQGPPGPGGMMGRRGPGMAGRPGRPGYRAMWRAPLTLMLRNRDELGLSATQVQNLEKLRGDYMREAIRRDADRKIAGLDLMALMRPDPADPMKAVDMPKVEAKVREIEKMNADGRLARIRAIEAGKAQLTPDQRTKFASLIAQMRSRWQRGGPRPQQPMPPAPPAGPRS